MTLHAELQQNIYYLISVYWILTVSVAHKAQKDKIHIFTGSTISKLNLDV